jgi:hypothetical protein
MVLKPEFAQPMIVAVADREGAEQLEAWIRPLKQEFGDRVDFFAIADVRPVPGPLQGMIRRSFRKRFSYRVAMDWKGVAVERLSAKPEVANLILLNRSGLIVTTVRGEAAGDNLALMTRAIRQELEREPSNEKETENSGKTR